MQTFKVGDLVADTKQHEADIKGLKAIVVSFTELQVADDYISCADVLKRVKGIYKGIEDYKDSIIKPLNVARKQIFALFNPYLDDLTLQESKLKKLMYDYDRKKELERLKKEAELEAQKQKEIAELNAKLKAEKDKAKKEELKQEIEMAKNTNAIVQTEQIKIEGISHRKKWVVEVVDAKKIPREYLIPDLKLLQDVADKNHDSLKIDGVVFKEISYIAAGSEK